MLLATAAATACRLPMPENWTDASRERAERAANFQLGRLMTSHSFNIVTLICSQLTLE